MYLAAEVAVLHSEGVNLMYANTLHLPDPTSPFILTRLFPNPARAGRCTSGGRAGRLSAALEAVLRLVEVALDLVGGDLDVG